MKVWVVVEPDDEYGLPVFDCIFDSAQAADAYRISKQIPNRFAGGPFNNQFSSMVDTREVIETEVRSW